MYVTNNFMFFPSLRRIFFPKYPCHYLLSHVPFESLTIKLQLMNQYKIVLLAISFSNQNEQPGALLKVLHTEKISLGGSPVVVHF